MALALLRPETRNLIDGQLVPASNGGTFENLNPATEEVLGTCADGTKDDVLAAIGAARRTFEEYLEAKVIALTGSSPNSGTTRR